VKTRNYDYRSTDCPATEIFWRTSSFTSRCRGCCYSARSTERTTRSLRGVCLPLHRAHVSLQRKSQRVTTLLIEDTCDDRTLLFQLGRHQTTPHHLQTSLPSSFSVALYHANIT